MGASLGSHRGYLSGNGFRRHDGRFIGGCHTVHRREQLIDMLHLKLFAEPFFQHSGDKSPARWASCARSSGSLIWTVVISGSPCPVFGFSLYRSFLPPDRRRVIATKCFGSGTDRARASTNRFFVQRVGRAFFLCSPCLSALLTTLCAQLVLFNVFMDRP